MGGRAAGFRPAVGGGVGRLSAGTDWRTVSPDFGPTALRSPIPNQQNPQQPFWIN